MKPVLGVRAVFILWHSLEIGKSITSVSSPPAKNRATELGCGTLGEFPTGQPRHQAWHGELPFLGKILGSNGKDGP